MRTAADGTRCLVAGLKVRVDEPVPAGEPGTIPICPMRIGGPAPGEAATAAEFWETVVLPRPELVIRPGKAIAGKDAYLEIGGGRTRRFSLDNPLGGPAIVIDAVATYTVDWGDATTTTTTSAGGPWPDGDVVHVWTDDGPYDVVVTAAWAATWTAGDASGTLTGLRTLGRIDDFPVQQVQAIRTR